MTFRSDTFRRLLAAVFAWAGVSAGGIAAAETPIAVATTAKADLAAEAVDSTEAELGQDWVRLARDAKGNVLGMQTAIVRYEAVPADGEGKSPIRIDLIGAVHVGDRDYYEGLNERFKEYDALLYELVAPEGTVVERGRGTSNAHPVGALQNGIKRFLELEHQLEQIDYTKKNFVHADMSPEQFMQAMKDRNESFLQMYFRMLGDSMAHQSRMSSKGESLDFELFAALFSSDRARRLKTALAKQLADMESMMVSFGGEQGSVIITERNKTALDVLKRELAAGKTKIGIFYGAGHLNDMDERLRRDFELRPVSATWMTAWKLSD